MKKNSKKIINVEKSPKNEEEVMVMTETSTDGTDGTVQELFRQEIEAASVNEKEEPVLMVSQNKLVDAGEPIEVIECGDPVLMVSQNKLVDGHTAAIDFNSIGEKYGIVDPTFINVFSNFVVGNQGKLETILRSLESKGPKLEPSDILNENTMSLICEAYQLIELLPADVSKESMTLYSAEVLSEMFGSEVFENIGEIFKDFKVSDAAEFEKSVKTVISETVKKMDVSENSDMPKIFSEFLSKMNVTSETSLVVSSKLIDHEPIARLGIDDIYDAAGITSIPVNSAAQEKLNKIYAAMASVR